MGQNVPSKHGTKLSIWEWTQQLARTCPNPRTPLPKFGPNFEQFTTRKPISIPKKFLCRKRCPIGPFSSSGTKPKPIRRLRHPQQETEIKIQELEMEIQEQEMGIKTINGIRIKAFGISGITQVEVGEPLIIPICNHNLDQILTETEMLTILDFCFNV